MPLTRSALLAAVVATTALCASLPSRAEDEAFPDRLMLRIGGYRVENADHLVRLDANVAPVGVYIDFAKTLGGETKANVARLDGLYRFGDAHGIGFSWYALRFRGDRRLETTISWGGEDYLLGTNVQSEIGIDVYKMNYQYSLLNDETAELGALIGLHVMANSIALSATGTGQAKSESVTAPLPVFGLFARYNFTPRFSIYYNYQFFFINYEDTVEGGLQDFLLGLEYRATRHLAVGAALNRFSMNLKSREDDSTLYLDTKWTGLMLYGSLYF